MNYADLILPLPLQGTFTYAVPASMQSAVRVGMRVLVPFGRSKTYLGIVARLHDERPQGYEVKSVAQLMDSEPIITPQQLQLWQWIADYYLAPIGDVYKAALPAGLKAEDGYRPKTETYIRLTPAYQNEAALHVALNVLARAPKQLEAFVEYLALSGWDQMDGGRMMGEVGEITREELLNASHASATTLQLLEKRGMLETYEVEVGRLNHGGDYHPELIKPLNSAQQTAYNSILMSMMKRPVTLLHGVTSSGKTEIYIHLIQQALERKEQVLYLLPEIALTVQMMQRLQRVFGNRLGIYHSKYSDADETRQPELVGKAIEAYRAMADKFPVQSIYAAYQCATMNNKLDKTGEKGLAKPDYQKVVDLLANKADRDNSENTMLKYSYHYLMSNAFLYGKNKALAKEYADKILAIDPEYAPAQQIKELK